MNAAETLPFIFGLILVGLQATLDRVWLKNYTAKYPRDGVLDDREPVVRWAADTAQFVPASIPALLGIALLLLNHEDHRTGEQAILIVVLLLGSLLILAVYVRAATRKLLVATTTAGLTTLQWILIALNVAGLVVALAFGATGDREGTAITCTLDNNHTAAVCERPE